MGKADLAGEAESSPASVLDLTDALSSLNLKKDETVSGERKQFSSDSSSKDSGQESGSDSDEAETITKSETFTKALTTEPEKKEFEASQGNFKLPVDDGVESDEDNENVVLEDDLQPKVEKAVKGNIASENLEEDQYQERGPCKVSRSFYSGSRYNPMLSELVGKGDPSLASFRCDDTTVYQPLTPPYCQGITLQDELAFDSSPLNFNDMVVPDLSDLTPTQETNLNSSPLYAGYSSPAPAAGGYNSPSAADYNSPAAAGYNNPAAAGYNNPAAANYNSPIGVGNNRSLTADYNDSSPPQNQMNYGYGPSSNGPSDVQTHLPNWTYNSECYSGDDSLNPLSFCPDLSTNFLEAIEAAVARTVDLSLGLPGSVGLEDELQDEASNENIRNIIDSLRSIDPNELDYIAPASPVAAHDDLEQELALSSEPWPENEALLSPSPPLTPSSPSLPSTPFSPSLSPPTSPDCGDQESRSSISFKELTLSCKAAVAAVREVCNPDVILSAAKRVACQDTEDICRKDRDGDTCIMIVVCKPCDSKHFYENLFVLQQHLQKLRLCCDQIVDSDHSECPICGADKANWRTLLSETNNAGDTVLSCAVKMRHPELVIDYLCAGLTSCEEDLRRVFDEAGRRFFRPYTRMYPGLRRFL
ncbi:uncharacterized protein LOC108672544 isoform X2 [Hyalella azteca]|uniref:Uncharacterized protein LOC108672544 isoform X2 n=1 Tax=Hyalella azteca TaxID=294128 RepID=A0A8B7NPS4_HYAAZ|nr:uncharacterized protein LOC108672544 isoform X2 [Hyalella azteca]